MLGLKLNHVNKRGPRSYGPGSGQEDSFIDIFVSEMGLHELAE